MKVFEKIVDLQNELFQVRKEGKSVGLVIRWAACMKDTLR